MSTSLTKPEIQARLRGLNLSSTGTREALAARLVALDELRAAWGHRPDDIATLTVPTLYALLRAIGVSAARSDAKATLVRIARRLATAPEPTPRPARSSRRSGWVVVWLNPATLMREVYASDVSSRASADRIAATARERARRLGSGARFLPEFVADGDFNQPEQHVRVVPAATGFYDPRETEAEHAAVRALDEVVRVDEEAMGAFLRGTRVASLTPRLDRAVARLRAAREALWSERGFTPPLRSGA